MIMVSATYFNYLCIEHCQGRWQGSFDISPNLPTPSELEFDIDMPLLKAIDKAADQFKQMVRLVRSFLDLPN